MRLLRQLSGTLALLLATAAIAPGLAVADTKSAAQKLFDEGATLMGKKDYAAACPKIKASMDLEPTDGTVLRLAVCYQAMGKWSSAWGLFRESISRAEKATPPRKDRKEMATKGIADVEKHLSYVTIEVKAEARAAGLEVKLDGEKVVDGMFGTAMPIDPGSHTLSASAPNKKPWETTFSIATTAEKKAVEVAKLEDVPASPTTAPTAPAPAPSGTSPSKDVAPQPPAPAGTPTIAYVALGAGALFIGGAVFSRIKMGSELDDYRARCADQLTVVCDDPDGRSRVRTWETLSWVSGGVGLAALGVGVALIVTAPRGEKKAAVTASPATLAGGPGLMISGAF